MEKSNKINPIVVGAGSGKSYIGTHHINEVIDLFYNTTSLKEVDLIQEHYKFMDELQYKINTFKYNNTPGDRKPLTDSQRFKRRNKNKQSRNTRKQNRK